MVTVRKLVLKLVPAVQSEQEMVTAVVSCTIVVDTEVVRFSTVVVDSKAVVLEVTGETTVADKAGVDSVDDVKGSTAVDDVKGMTAVADVKEMTG